MHDSPLVGLALLAVLGTAAQWIAWRLRAPSILFLLITGIAAGPGLGLIRPDALLGDLLLPFVSLSVGLILYEGGLSLSVRDLPKVGSTVRNLVTVGVLVSWAVSAVAAVLIFELSVSLAVLLGAILVVTGPTVIGPLLQTIRPTGPSGAALRWEGIVIDPIGALLAVLVFEAISARQVEDATASVVAGIIKTIIFGGGLGLFAAALLTFLLHRRLLPDFLENGVSLMFVVSAFVASNLIQHESGLLAVTVMGIALANQRFVTVKRIVEFKENLRVLLISVLFLLLAARLDPVQLQALIVPALIFVAVLIVVGRPLSVLAATWGSSLARKDRLFIAGIAPRGIVAAAVSSVFALQLENNGFEGADLLVPVTFAVIIGTVAFYGLVGPFIARRLGVADSSPQGVLMVGAHSWAIALAKTLASKGFRVLMVDTNRENTAAARMAGLPTYTGSILGDYALDDLDLGGIGRMAALTPNDWVNVLAVQRFERILGAASCYRLPAMQAAKGKKGAHQHLEGRRLFREDANFAQIASLHGSGATVKATPLSESFNYPAFRERYRETAIPLCVITEDKKLEIIAADKPIEPKPGQTLVALVREPKTAEDKAKEKKAAKVQAAE